MASIHCYCENEVEICYEKEYDLEKQSQLIDQILDGSFLNFTCGKCEKILKPEFQITFKFPKKKMNIFLVPEMESSTFLLDNLKIPKVQRVVLGYRELVEKLTIMKAGLEDTIVEIVKYYIVEKINPEKEIKVLFDKKDNNTLVFHIHGLKPDEIGLSQIPVSFYEDVKEKFPELKNEEPYSVILKEPYVSINKIYWENEE